MKLGLFGQAVSEEMLEHRGRQRTDGRWRRTPEHGFPISSHCEPKGSGELKISL